MRPAGRRAEHRACARQVARRRARGRRAALLGALAADVGREPRRPVRARGVGDGVRGHGSAEAREPVPAGVAEPGGAVCVDGDADERGDQGPGAAGAEEGGAGADRVHERPHRDAVRARSRVRPRGQRGTSPP